MPEQEKQITVFKWEPWRTGCLRYLPEITKLGSGVGELIDEQADRFLKTTVGSNTSPKILRNELISHNLKLGEGMSTWTSYTAGIKYDYQEFLILQIIGNYLPVGLLWLESLSSEQ